MTAPVSRDLEIAEITDRVSKGPADRNVALLFESVAGIEHARSSSTPSARASAWPRRSAWSASTISVHRVAKLLDLRMPGSLFDKLKKLGDVFDLVKAGPKHVRSAPCQEVVETDRPSLAALAHHPVLAR